MAENFKLLANVKVNDRIPVRKYKSEKTGLTVILADVEGPVVNGYFCLATEAHDDDGLPHTLEHLIFLGSEKYPFKGVLDLIANRCLASGTNAWTDTDHTCYTMTTAGSDGYLSLLPIYLDHILYPTLTDAGFITEVHHISGEGEDGGVVYCEMQGRENSGESRIHLELLRAIYPGSGYCAETGGIMKNLRESTNNEKVRAYHEKFYRPDNLTVIVTGQVKPEDLFKSLEPVEQKIISKGKKAPFERPWQSPIDPLTESKDIKIVYPNDEEDCGIVCIGYRGPKATTEHHTLNACSILMRYLSDTSVSPLMRDMVEISDPFASKVGYNLGENSVSLLYFSFDNVPLDKVDMVHPKYHSVIENIAKGAEKIDMKRLQNIIDKSILESLNSLESNPHDDIAFHSIGYILYGDSEDDFTDRLNSNKLLAELKQKDETFWIDLLKKYFVNAKYVVVRAVPSIEEQQRMAKEEQERIEKQRSDLGPAGLEKKEKELLEAMKTNEINPPVEMLTDVPIPSVEKMNFHPLKIFRLSDKVSPPGLNLETLPVYAEAFDLHSNFVYIITSLNTEKVPLELRPYLLLFTELLTESPIMRDGKLIPYEEVVAQLEADTVATGTRIGLEPSSRFTCGPFSNALSIMIQVEQQKYETGAKWLTELLHQTQFTLDRIKVTTAKMVNDVAQAKRKGSTIARGLLQAIYYNPDTNVQLLSLLKQQKFLNGILEKLEKPNGVQSIIDDLNKIRDIITNASNVALHLAADWQKLAKLGMDLSKPLANVVKETNEVKSPGKMNNLSDWKMINYDGFLEKGYSGCILGMGCVESAFLYSAVNSINDFMSDDLPPLMLFLQYLTQLEGPLWRQIRGPGYAYGYNIVPRPHEGLLSFGLYRSTNVVAAYKEAKRIVEDQLKPESEWDSTLLESARSSLIFEIIEREKSIGDVVCQALLSTFKDVPVEYNKILVKKVNSVTHEDLKRVGEKYVATLFSPKARYSIVCHPDKMQDIKAAFDQLGLNLKPENSLEESILA
uniref:CSON007777 protein n=1 Tax=Culicoides sonorensis TaxID=179676 RepID=A0A336KC94_CULSO